MNDTIHVDTQARVRATPEVLVVGGGPAGIGAAIAAARRGARTMLVERMGFLGGNLTAGLVGPCMTSYSLDGTKQLIRGIYDELILRMEADGEAIHPSKVPAGSPYAGFIYHGHDKVTPFEPEGMKLTAQRMCLEAGVELLFHTFVVDTIVEDGAVRGVIVASKSGLEAITADVVIDCSADADVVAFGGGETVTGREGDGLVQPMTLFFRVGGVDDAAVAEYVAKFPSKTDAFEVPVQAARAAGEYTIERRGLGLYQTMKPGVWRVNTTRILRRVGTDVYDLTQAEIEGREQVMQLMRLFRRVPGMENCELLDTAATIGVRETRRIVGEYTLTHEDLASGREFDDVIALAGYPIDIHSPTDSGGGLIDMPVANEYQIPYRSLVPRTLDGILVAGRSVSSTHEALGAIRIMPPAFAMGQAAGTAAAISVAAGTQPRDVDVSALQKALVEDGAFIGDRAMELVQ
jgi:hypothetical protein